MAIHQISSLADKISQRRLRRVNFETGLFPKMQFWFLETHFKVDCILLSECQLSEFWYQPVVHFQDSGNFQFYGALKCESVFVFWRSFVGHFAHASDNDFPAIFWIFSKRGEALWKYHADHRNSGEKAQKKRYFLFHSQYTYKGVPRTFWIHLYQFAGKTQ